MKYFEDIQIVGDRFFLISSTGTLVEFGEGSDGARVPYTSYDTGLGRDCEIEGLTSDPSTRALLLSCKHIYRAEWRRNIVVMAWSLDRKSLEAAPRLRVPYDQISGPTGARGFETSAITFAPDHRSLVLIAGPQAKSKAGLFAWKAVSRSLAYAARRIGEITDDVEAIDLKVQTIKLNTKFGDDVFARPSGPSDVPFRVK